MPDDYTSMFSKSIEDVGRRQCIGYVHSIGHERQQNGENLVFPVHLQACEAMRK
jgi:hypothetical protein